MANAFLEGAIAEGRVIAVSAGSTATKGDWMAFSGHVAIAVTDATPVADIYKYSAAGMALEHNPRVDDQGAWVHNSAMLIARQGVARVTAGLSATALTIPIGVPTYPDLSASGIVGQTGRTGIGPIWNTAAPAVLSTAAGGTAKVAAMPMGVAQVIRVIGEGDATGFAFDIAFNLATNAF